MSQVVAEARAHLGERLAGSPWQDYFAGLSTNWCAMFASWLIRDQNGAKSASSTAVYDYYAARGRVGTTPRAGALIFYSYDGTRYDIYHIGIVESVNGGVAQTIEGNTPGTLPYTQTTVTSYSRPWSSLVLYAYPEYSDVVITEPPLIEGESDKMQVIKLQDGGGFRYGLVGRTFFQSGQLNDGGQGALWEQAYGPARVVSGAAWTEVQNMVALAIQVENARFAQIVAAALA
ncbi:CHAP domain-containing protein [Agromyces ramosus]|uniref:Peptidase C51 domain-containing protein n=1 Tax=Agromyces ramosus TaxID=33879 RepID=A0ABU0R8M8_9MICO|nr:CHAP domain-containing protein [Agromyces ramosus]MDQ0894413.1 hypothetical protein [Agromyces ramosus]